MLQWFTMNHVQRSLSSWAYAEIFILIELYQTSMTIIITILETVKNDPWHEQNFNKPGSYSWRSKTFFSMPIQYDQRTFGLWDLRTNLAFYSCLPEKESGPLDVR